MGASETGRVRSIVRDLLFGAALIVALFVAYWPALHGGFVIDDKVNVTKPELQSLAGLWRIWSELGSTQQYYPFLYSTYWLEHRLWGDAVFGYHVANLLQHALAAGLLVALLRRLALPGAWFAGFLFAFHPIAVESVAWIAEQKNTLSTALGLGAALAYVCFDRSRRPLHYALGLALFVAALWSKTVVATIPAALVVVLWWQRGRLDLRRDVMPLVPWFAIGIGGGLFSAWVERRFVGATGADFAVPFVDRALIASRALWFYVGKLVWPFDLQFMYPRWKVGARDPLTLLFPVLALIAAIGVGWLARRVRGPAAATMLFVGLLSPMLGFLNIYWFLISFVADHFLYWPGLALIAGFAVMLWQWAQRAAPAIRSAVMFGCVVLVSFLGVLTWRHSRIFSDYQTLCRETLARNPGAWMMHHNLGVELANDPARLPEAMAHFRETIRLQPTFADAHYNLAQALQRLPDKLDEAIGEYRIAARLNPIDLEAGFNFANALATRGDLAPAIVEYQRVLALRPDFVDAHVNLARALEEAGRSPAEAIGHLETAVRLDPQNVDARNRLGRLLMQQPGGLPDAIAHLTAAHRLAPDFAEAAFNLSNAFANAGRTAEAIASFEDTLKLNPDLMAAHYNLGCLLAQVPGRTAEARAHLQTVLRLQPGFEPAIKMLGQLSAAP